MLSDFKIVEHKFGNEDINLLGVFDLHHGAREHLEHEWNEFCLKIAKEKNTYLILGGDLMNNTTRSSVANVFEEVMRPREQKKRLVEMLEPLHDHILFITPGNHERRSMKDADDDPMYDIACKLDLEDLYRENLGVIKLKFGNNRSDGAKHPVYIIVVTHGAGGGVLTGGVVNKVERFGYAIDGADLIMVGHSHKPFITQPAKLKIDSHHNSVEVVSQKIMSMSSWLEYGGYAARGMMLPNAHCVQVAHFNSHKKEIKITM